MAKVWPAATCPITGAEREEINKKLIDLGDSFEKAGVYWHYKGLYDQLLIVSDELYRNDIWQEKNREILYVLHNDLWPKGNQMIDYNMLSALISSSNVPDSPMEKLGEVLFYCKSVSEHFGSQLHAKQQWKYNSHLLRKSGMVNEDELEQILYAGIELGFLKDEGSSKSSFPISLTLKGWGEADKLQTIKGSKIAFVAMSFDRDMISVYNKSMEPAIKECGFEPYIVFDQHPESDVTINDAILAGIKKAKFTIADFTHHKSGVYFEAGYALGRGQKVIYTCQEDHIDTAHFDTRNYQHLVWKDGADLKKKLMDKIEVFIKA